MRIEFSNKKERKNCQGFIRALREVQKHHSKDSEKPVFITLFQNDLRLSPSSIDPHFNKYESGCQIVLKSQAFSIQEESIGQVFKFKSFKLLRAFRKNEHKIVLIEVNIENDGNMNVYFETQNQNLMVQVKVQCTPVEVKWFQSIESTKENNYELIPIGKVGEGQLSSLSFGEGKDNLWIQISQTGFFVRTMLKGKYRHESQIKMGSQANFNFGNLKAKLKNRIFINLAGLYFLEHLHEIQKKKKIGVIYIKIIWDQFIPNKIRYSYLITKVINDLGHICKIVQCQMCQQMRQENQIGIQQEAEEKNRMRQGLLLKRQEGLQQVRRIIINKITQIDENQRQAERAFLERNLVSKIEQGDQTITRRFESKY